MSASISAEARVRRPFAPGPIAARFFWTTPHWWTLALALAAWILMIQHARQHGAHLHHVSMSAREESWHWLLMIVAMMVPFLAASLKSTAFRSYAFRRHRAQGLFLLGYLGTWVVAGIPAVLAHRMAWTHTHAAAGGAFVLAALWLLVPVRRRALTACHRLIPMAPLGWRSDMDCVRFGTLIGTSCVLTCWPLMFACHLTGHALPAMIGGTVIAGLERGDSRRLEGVALPVTLALASWFLALAAIN